MLYNLLMNEINRTLRKFGLTNNEIKIYLASLKNDDLSPYKLSKLTNIPRTTVYDILMNLSLKGLVELEQSDGFTKQQTRVKAKNPSKLRSIIKSEHNKLNSLELDVIHILPSLKKDYHSNQTDTNFQYYPGIEGAKKVFDFTATLNTPTLSWTHLMPMDAFGEEWTNSIIDKAIKKKINHSTIDKELIPLNDWTRHVLSYQFGRDRNYLRKNNFRYIENEAFELYLRFEIQGEYVSIACANEDEVWGLSIRSKAFSKSLTSIYNMMWNMARPITKELIESWGENSLLKEEFKRK